MDAYVSRMTADKWTGVLCGEDETLMPTIEDVGQAVRALDAETRTLVSLYGRGGAHLTIGGGAGQYILYVSTSDAQLWNLVADAKEGKSGVVMLNAGGQKGDFPARQVLAQPQVLQAAQAFLQTGALDSSLRWERQT